MTIEADLRVMGQALQQEFAIVERMITENEYQMATEELVFAKDELSRYRQKIANLNGKKVGLAGRIFRHPYYVPEEFPKIAEAMDVKAKQLEARLTKKIRAAKEEK